MIIALPPHYKPPEVKKPGRGGNKGEMGAHCSSVRNLSIVETSYHSLKYNFSSSSPLSQHFGMTSRQSGIFSFLNVDTQVRLSRVYADLITIDKLMGRVLALLGSQHVNLIQEIQNQVT